MAASIVLQHGMPFAKDVHNWEDYFYQKACQQARAECTACLRELDDELLKQKPQEWQVVGKRRRTVVTRFGGVCIERRLYRDEHGQACFLLDEYLGLPPQQAATPCVTETVVGLAAEVSFEQTAKHLQRMTAGVLSKSTLWWLLQTVGKRALQAEERLREVVYEQGYLPEPGKRQTEWLYIAADGVWVRLQRKQKQKRAEIVWG